MERRIEGYVTYNEGNDSFVYEIRSVDTDSKGNEVFGEWGMVQTAKCVRREGAKDDEDTNYVSYKFLLTILDDIYMHDVDVRMGYGKE